MNEKQDKVFNTILNGVIIDALKSEDSRTFSSFFPGGIKGWIGEIRKRVKGQSKEVAFVVQELDEKDCDEIINVVNGYKFKLPLITDELSDDALARYMDVLKTDKNLNDMLDKIKVIWKKKGAKL